jgi:hypothetical protein
MDNHHPQISSGSPMSQMHLASVAIGTKLIFLSISCLAF